MTLEFDNVTHRFGDNTALSKLNLQVKTGEITCLFGASGSGKSTLLRITAGIESLQEGRILLNGETLATPNYQPEPEKRPVGLMFQEHALFPHMTVGENIAFGIRHLNQAEKQDCVDYWLNEIALGEFDHRYPHTLSGGQAQRVALARALAPKPKVLLMDEPFASIDTVLRKKLRESTRRLVKQSACTVLFVTHDPTEAMEVADTIAILERGQIFQHAKPENIFNQPSTKHIAKLFGDSVSLEATRVQTGFNTAYGVIKTDLSEAHKDGKRCTLLIRPKNVTLQHDSVSQTLIKDIRFVGDGWLAWVSAPNQNETLGIYVDQANAFSIGDAVSMLATENELMIFD